MKPYITFACLFRYSKKVWAIPLFLMIIGHVFLTTACQKPDRIAPEEAYVKLYGGGYNQQAADMVHLPNGGFLLLGSTWSDSDNQHSDILLIQTDDAGNEVWSTTFDNNNQEDIASQLIQTEQGYVIIGTSTPSGGFSNVWIIELNTTGQQTVGEYEVGFSNTHETGKSIQPVSDGYLIIGTTTAVDSLKAEGFQKEKDLSDILIAKIDLNGQLLWTKAIGYQGIDEGVSIATLSDGENFAVLGTTDFPQGNTTDKDFMLSLINSSGNPYLTMNFGAPDRDEIANDLAITQSGDFIMIGTASGTENQLTLYRADPTLTQLPIEQIPGTEGNAVTVLADTDDLLIAGSADEDMLIARLGSTNSWQRHFGGKQGIDSGQMALMPDGDHVMLVGTIDFYANTMISLIKTDASGNLIP